MRHASLGSGEHPARFANALRTRRASGYLSRRPTSAGGLADRIFLHYEFTTVMARTASAAVGRGLALAISFLLLGVANGDVGHAFASREAQGLGPAVLATSAPPAAPDSAPPHEAPDCPLCRAARVSSVILNAGAGGALSVPESSRATSLPETLAPPAPRRRTETARSPPAPPVV